MERHRRGKLPEIREAFKRSHNSEVSAMKELAGQIQALGHTVVLGGDVVFSLGPNCERPAAAQACYSQRKTSFVLRMRK